EGGHYKTSTLIYSCIGRMMDSVLSENMTLCQAYARNLNSYAPLSSPMVCERLLNPVFPEFSRPPWQNLNPQDHVALIKQMDLLLFYRWHPENFQEQQWMERLKQDLATNQIKLRLARLDV